MEERIWIKRFSARPLRTFRHELEHRLDCTCRICVARLDRVGNRCDFGFLSFATTAAKTPSPASKLPSLGPIPSAAGQCRVDSSPRHFMWFLSEQIRAGRFRAACALRPLDADCELKDEKTSEARRVLKQRAIVRPTHPSVIGSNLARRRPKPTGLSTDSSAISPDIT